MWVERTENKIFIRQLSGPTSFIVSDFPLLVWEIFYQFSSIINIDDNILTSLDTLCNFKMIFKFIVDAYCIKLSSGYWKINQLLWFSMLHIIESLALFIKLNNKAESQCNFYY